MCIAAQKYRSRNKENKLNYSRHGARDIFPGITTIGHFLRNLTAHCGSRVNAITVLTINLQREVKTNWKTNEELSCHRGYVSAITGPRPLLRGRK
ncbi:hypothetical protein PUN28_004094 [Cardiocondyla obscurior]|uniref:Uncharacterized protein n=1 Tax=Cardiocondyla obscurior TaxID=286306 RepID=A0AAW2GPI1_9HYME